MLNKIKETLSLQNVHFPFLKCLKLFQGAPKTPSKCNSFHGQGSVKSGRDGGVDGDVEGVGEDDGGYEEGRKRVVDGEVREGYGNSLAFLLQVGG